MFSSISSITMYGGWAALRTDVEYATYKEYKD